MTTTTTDPEIGWRICAAGIGTNYHDLGTATADNPPVLLLHGSGPGVSAWANWRTALPGLARGRRVLAPDIVGFGYTDRPDDFTYDRDNWITHLLGFLDAHDLPQVSLVGNSFGGALALWLAATHPERVHRLVLMGSAGVSFPLTPGLDAVWGYQPSPDAMAGVMRYFAHDPTRITDDLVQLRYQASKRPGVAEAYSTMFPAPRQDGIEQLALTDDELRRIPHPTLLVHGRDDQVIPVSTSQRLNQLIDHSELHVFGRCGHWVQIEAGDRFVDLVTAFLDRP
jgi:pimeloyl-ACP methyl ester carboxylesterase